MTTSTRERRDWALLIFLIPIGVIFMLIAGQFAIRLVPNWSINAGMQSSLDPNNLPKQQNGPVQPILPAILTPLGWFETFLTPGADANDQNILFPPFVVFEPSATPVVTTNPPTAVTPPPTVPVTDTPIVTASPPVTTTKKPPVDPTSTPPTSTPPTVSPSPVPTSITSTPVGIPVSAPTDIVNVPPNGTPSPIVPGTYVILDIGSSPIVVSNTSDGNYDLILYEATYTQASGDVVVLMDQISILISQDGIDYYEIFNWGDNAADTNTNVNFNDLPADCVQECDNREIPITPIPATGSILYTDPVTGINTGILIDVDTAPDNPPEGIYKYMIIVSPLSGDLDAAQVDSIVVAEVPLGAGGVSAASAGADPVQPVEEVLDSPADEPPADEPSAPPADEPPADEPSAPPADEPPSSP
jgi:hypothetical protein